MRKLKGVLLAGSLLIYSLTISTNVVSASDHVHEWSKWTVIKEPTCKEYGSRERHCLTCTTKEVEYYKSNTHTWGAWTTLTDSTCQKDGQRYRQCSVCEKIEYSTIPKDSTKHLFSTWNVKNPTIFASGYKTRTCLYCNKKETVTLKKIKATVSLNKNSIKLRKKGTYTLKIKKYTKSDKIKSWKTNKKNIVTVNNKGKVKAKKKGKAVITVYMKSGAKASCKVTVK